MADFVFEPTVGAIPLKFGMRPDEVSSAISPALASHTGVMGITGERRRNISVGYDSDKTVFEMIFTPGVNVFFEKHELLSEPNLLAFLRNYDAEPQLWVGFVVFVKLGVKLSGFHGDDPEKSIGMIRDDVLQKYKKSFVPFE